MFDEQKKTCFFWETCFFTNIAFSLELNKMVEESHRTFKCRLAATFNFHVNVQLDFGNTSQIGH